MNKNIRFSIKKAAYAVTLAASLGGTTLWAETLTFPRGVKAVSDMIAGAGDYLYLAESYADITAGGGVRTTALRLNPSPDGSGSYEGVYYNLVVPSPYEKVQFALEDIDRTNPVLYVCHSRDSIATVEKFAAGKKESLAKIKPLGSIHGVPDQGLLQACAVDETGTLYAVTASGLTPASDRKVHQMKRGEDSFKGRPPTLKNTGALGPIFFTKVLDSGRAPEKPYIIDGFFNGTDKTLAVSQLTSTDDLESLLKLDLPGTTAGSFDALRASSGYLYASLYRGFIHRFSSWEDLLVDPASSSYRVRTFAVPDGMGSDGLDHTSLISDGHGNVFISSGKDGLPVYVIPAGGDSAIPFIGVPAGEKMAIYPSGDYLFSAVKSAAGENKIHRIELSTRLDPYSVPPPAVKGTPYGYAIRGDGPITRYSLTAGALPKGILLTATTGVLRGTPSESGFFTFEITAKNLLPGHKEAKNTYLIWVKASAPCRPAPSEDNISSSHSDSTETDLGICPGA